MSLEVRGRVKEMSLSLSPSLSPRIYTRYTQRHKQTQTHTDTHHLFGSLHMDSEIDVPERPRPKLLRDLVRFVGPHLGLGFKD